MGYLKLNLMSLQMVIVLVTISSQELLLLLITVETLSLLIKLLLLLSQELPVHVTQKVVNVMVVVHLLQLPIVLLLIVKLSHVELLLVKLLFVVVKEQHLNLLPLNANLILNFLNVNQFTFMLTMTMIVFAMLIPPKLQNRELLSQTNQFMKAS